jgi:hypothetical protein
MKNMNTIKQVLARPAPPPTLVNPIQPPPAKVPPTTDPALPPLRQQRGQIPSAGFEFVTGEQSGLAGGQAFAGVGDSGIAISVSSVLKRHKIWAACYGVGQPVLCTIKFFLTSSLVGQLPLTNGNINASKKTLLPTFHTGQLINPGVNPVSGGEDMLVLLNPNITGIYQYGADLLSPIAFSGLFDLIKVNVDVNNGTDLRIFVACLSY